MARNAPIYLIGVTTGSTSRTDTRASTSDRISFRIVDPWQSVKFRRGARVVIMGLHKRTINSIASDLRLLDPCQCTLIVGADINIADLDPLKGSKIKIRIAGANDDVNALMIEEINRFGAERRLEASSADMNSRLAGISDKIDMAITALSDLRINSIGQTIDDLRKISSDLKSKNGGFDTADTDDVATRVLMVLSGIFDLIDNSRIAALVVAGAVTAFVGATGWSAAPCLAITLGAWKGKEEFIAAVTAASEKARKLRKRA